VRFVTRGNISYRAMHSLESMANQESSEIGE
jgi:hypothetical protein